MSSASLDRLADPIVAVATASGPGAVGIVRLSGHGLAPLARALLGGMLPQPRMAHYGPLRGADGAVLDQALALWFPAPHSYTGEDVLELQAHGGPVLLQLLVARCLELARQAEPLDPQESRPTPAPDGSATGQPRLARLRLAEPGEFTQRAFLNDKLDLAQAEAVADLIDAGTESAARSAGRSLSGEFSRAIHDLAERLVKLRLLVEATLDFPEEDIDFLEQADARGKLAAAQQALVALRGKASQGRLLRDGLQVVLAGQPNVGKSSLLNALAGAELAIVTPIAGTTRDKVSGSIQIDGVPVHVTDTAGLRDATDDAIERIGIARSWAAIEAADAVLFLHDRTQRGNAAHEAADAAIGQVLAQRAPRHVLHLHNKLDLAPDAGVLPPPAPAPHRAGADALAGEHLDISAVTGAGLPALRRWLLASAGWNAAPEGVFTARQRHLDALARCADHLESAHRQLNARLPALELFAEELRLAHRALGEIVGEFSTEDLLGAIFSRFCIGK